MRSRIKNKKGFSISEMLMVVMILSLIIVMLGSGVMVVKNSYEKITLKAEAQTLLSTTITKVSDEFRFAKYVNADDNPKAAKFVSGNLGYEIWFKNDDGSSGMKGILICNNAGVSAQLLTDKTMTSRLTPSIEYQYDKDNRLFTATITIATRDNDKFLEQEIKVKPINNRKES
ncbi:Uncharacterised protein [uncultured Eubacterium sp.]|nr:Uncharacterised protein [uncultured Eubacterium sp.]